MSSSVCPFPAGFEAKWTLNNAYLKKSFLTTEEGLLIGSLGLLLVKSRKMAALSFGAFLTLRALKYIFRIQTIPAVRAVLSESEQREKADLISQCEVINVTTPDGIKLKAYFRRSKELNPSEKTILLFQGNNIKLPSDSLLREKFPDYHLLFFTYRGVDESEGCPASSRDLFLDGDSVFQLALSLRVPLFVCAWSLGAGIASNVLAAHSDSAPVILDRTFASTMKLAAHRVAEITLLPKRFLEKVLSVLMWLADWQINTSAAVEKMKNNRKICILTLPHDELMVEGVRLEAERGLNITPVNLPDRQGGVTYFHRTKLGEFPDDFSDVWNFFS